MTVPPASTPKISLAKKGEGGSAATQSVPHAAAKVDGLALVMARNAFYQHNYKNILYIVLGQVVMVATLVAVLIKLLDYTTARDYYFPMRQNNELIQELPLTEPLFTDTQIKEWAEEAVTHTLTFGYYDHLMRLQDSRAYFTTPGWAAFTKALSDARVLAKIGAFGVTGAAPQGKVVVTNIRPGTHAEIQSEGIGRNGRYEWRVHLVVDLSFYDTEQQYRQSWNVDLRILRVRAMSSRYGIGIHELLAESASE